jgi:hypothetical protein
VNRKSIYPKSAHI